MPSFFGRKRHDSTPAPTPPLPPPKEFNEHSRAPHSDDRSIPWPSAIPRSNPINSYSHSPPPARTRRTSDPAYSRSYSSFSPSLSSTPDSRTLQPYSRVSAYTSLPRRPSPLSGPPLVVSSAATSSSHSHRSSSRPTAEEEGSSSLVGHRAGSSRTPPAPRPQSELLLPSSRVTRTDTRRSISVIGDDWTHAYEAVEYDLDLDLDFGRRLESRGVATTEPTDRDGGYGGDGDAESHGETDPMLRAGPQAVARASTVPGEKDYIPSTGDNSTTHGSTRHARTPSAGWQAWSGDYDQDYLNLGIGTASSTEQTRLPSPVAPPSTSPPSDRLPFPVPAIFSNHPSSLRSPRSAQGIPGPQSTPSVHRTSSQTTMGSINTDAPLPPLPTPVKSPLLESTRSKSHEPVSALIVPPIPPDKSPWPTTLQEEVVSRVSPNAQPHEPAAVSSAPHVQAATDGSASSLRTPLVSGSGPTSTSASVVPVRVDMVSVARRSNDPAESTPLLSSPELHISSTSAQTLTEGRLVSSSDPPHLSPALPPAVDRPTPPFLVLSYKGPPATTFPATKPSPGTPLPSLLPIAEPTAAAVVLPASTPMQGTSITPPGGAPQLRNQSSSPLHSSPPPTVQTLKRPSSFPATTHTFLSPSPSSSPPSTQPPVPQARAATPVHPWHTPRGSMILYHVSLPSPSGARPGLPHVDAHRSFGGLGTHTNHGAARPIDVGEDGMLLPPGSSGSSGSASSSALNLFSGANVSDAATPPTPPPANRYSSHSHSPSSTYSVSADSVAAPSYSSTPPLEDRDSKYAVGLMMGTTKSAQSQFQALPRIGTPLAASFALRDLRSNTGTDAHSVIDLKEGARGSILGGGGGGGPLVAYAYDPDEDDSDDDTDGRGSGGRGADWLHDPDVWPYADGDDDFHARRGDWSTRGRTWWGGTKERSAGGGRKDDMVQVEMLGSSSTTSRASTLKTPLQSQTSPDPSSHPRAHLLSYLPPYRPPTALETLLGRGAASALTLVVLVVGLLALFLVYPITQVYGPEAGVAAKILGNTAINSTGQAVV